MKDRFILLIGILLLFMGCSTDDEHYDAQEITMITESNYLWAIYTGPVNSQLSVNWGDGTEQVYLLEKSEKREYGGITLEYRYTDTTVNRRTVKAKGHILGLVTGFHELIELDVTRNPALESLSCWNNYLTELDVSQNRALVALECGNNQLTTLDLTYNPRLETLKCQGNRLVTLKISDNTALDYIDCSGNQFTEDAINQIYHALPVRERGTLIVSKPYGEFQIAEKKGWVIYKI